jgi:Leucine-rich repeat (LRR) protein
MVLEVKSDHHAPLGLIANGAIDRLSALRFLGLTIGPPRYLPIVTTTTNRTNGKFDDVMNVLVHLTKLTSLILENFGLRRFYPNTLCTGATSLNLENIKVPFNSFDEVPVFLQGCTKLTELDFRDNAVRTIPAFLSSLEKLTSLDLSGNPVCLQLTGGNNGTPGGQHVYC